MTINTAYLDLISKGLKPEATGHNPDNVTFGWFLERLRAFSEKILKGDYVPYVLHEIEEAGSKTDASSNEVAAAQAMRTYQRDPSTVINFDYQQYLVRYIKHFATQS